MLRKPPLPPQRVQHPAEAAELLLGQEPLRPARPVPGHETARIAAGREDLARGLGPVEHARQNGDRLVRGGGCLAEPVVQVRDALAPERGNRHLSERRQQVPFDHPAIPAGRVRLAAHRHVLAEIPLREAGHRRSRTGVRRPGRRRLLAGLYAGDDHRRPPPRVVGGDHPVPAQGHPPRTARAPALHQVDLDAGRIDPHPEAGQLRVPENDVPAAPGQSVDGSLRKRPISQLRHA